MQKDTVAEHLSSGSRFYIALGHYMQTFSFLEWNLGLCIRLLVNRKDVRVAHPFLQRLSTHQKIEVLKDLIVYRSSNGNPKMISDFIPWFKRIAKTKAARNRYIHGVWKWRPMNRETPIRFTLVNWAYGPNPNIDENSLQDMTLSDFEQIVAEMEDVYQEFQDLRQEHGI